MENSMMNSNGTATNATSDELPLCSSLYLCGACHNPVTWSQKAILCDICDLWFHLECHNIPSVIYSRLGDSDAEWICHKCHVTANTSSLHLNNVSDAVLSTSSNISIPSFDSSTEPKHTSSPVKSKPTWKKGKPLRIINVNCQSLVNKKGPWSHLIEGCRPDVIIATETWLDKTINDSELECANFTIYRQDRKVGIHGGILIAVSSAIKSSAVSIETTAEILWAKLSCKGQRDLLIGACYRNIASDKTTIPELFATIDTLTAKHNYDILIGGDFNFPSWDWATQELKPNTQYVQLHNEFRNLLTEYELKQLVTEPTRESNTLDLLITNIPSRVIRTTVIHGISEHHIPLLDLSLKTLNRYQVPRLIRLYNKADWEAMKSYLAPKLRKITISRKLSPESLWQTLKSHLQAASAKFIHVPTKCAKRKDSCPWINPYLRQLLTKRDNLFTRSKENGQVGTEKEHKKLKATCQRLMRRQHNTYVHNMFTDVSQNASTLNKRFWTYVKHRRAVASQQSDMTTN